MILAFIFFFVFAFVFGHLFFFENMAMSQLFCRSYRRWNLVLLFYLIFSNGGEDFAWDANWLTFSNWELRLVFIDGPARLLLRGGVR